MKELLRYRELSRVHYYHELLEAAGISTFILNDNLSSAEGVYLPEFFPALCIMNDEDEQNAIDLIKRDIAAKEPSNLAEQVCPICNENSPAIFDTCWNCSTSLSPA